MRKTTRSKCPRGPQYVGVARELDRLAGLPRDEPVRAVREGRPVVSGRRKALSREPMRRQKRQDERHLAEGIGLAKHRAKATVVQGLDPLETVEEGLKDGSRHGRIDDLSNREDRVRRRHGTPVLPDRLRPKRDHVRASVGGDLHRRGETGREVQPGIEVEEVALDVLQHLRFRKARLEDRVQGRRLADQPALKRPAVGRRAFAAFVQEGRRRHRCRCPGDVAVRTGGRRFRPARHAAATTRTVNAAPTRLIGRDYDGAARIRRWPFRAPGGRRPRAPRTKPSRRCARRP